MRRNIIFIGIGIIAIILIVLFPVASTITGKSRDAAVEKFNAKISQIEKRYPALHKPKHLPSKKDAAIAPEETADTNGSHEDSIKAYKRLFKKAKSSGIDAGSSLLFIKGEDHILRTLDVVN